MRAKARDDEERRGIQRYGIISGAIASTSVIGMCVGTVYELPYQFFIGLWAGYVVLYDWLVLIYLPRVTARRLALERAEDSSSVARQRRERLASLVMPYCANRLLMFSRLSTACWAFSRSCLICRCVRQIR
ncbi:MAG: hypothetical protein ACJ8AT_04070 [Hyalangium sp.]